MTHYVDNGERDQRHDGGQPEKKEFGREDEREFKKEMKKGVKNGVTYEMTNEMTNAAGTPTEYNLKDISNRLNSIYWKDRKDGDVPPPLIQIAPMINVTNRHFRMLIRMLTKNSQLWTEMTVDTTLLYNQNNLDQYLGYDNSEHPIVCQLGGSDLTSMSEAAVLVQQFGYDELNINVGCPSNKVANRGTFGAYLMKQPEHVQNIIYEIKKRVQIPVSVKIRTGVDNLDSFEYLQNFIQTVSSAGCNHFIVHARKAWLKGLDPKKNRTVPPLEYKKVFDLCQLFPDMKFTLNGGVQTVEEAIALLNGYMPVSQLKKNIFDDEKFHNHLNSMNSIEKKGTNDDVVKKWSGQLLKKENEMKQHMVKVPTYIKIPNYDKAPLNGIMIGRASMENTVVLSQIDKLIYNDQVPSTAYSRRTVLEAYILYLEQTSFLYSVVSAFELLKPILGILKGMPGHRIFRNKLDFYIRTYATTLQCSEILEKAITEVDKVAPGVLDLPLASWKLQEEYIKNF